MNLPVVTRAFTIGLGLAGILWGIATFPIVRQASPLEDIAARIIRGQVFKLETLLELVPALDAIERQSWCRAASLRSDAVIRMRIAEETLIQADGPRIDERFAELRAAILKSLACSPTDSFLWLSLYWLEVTTNGFDADRLKYLRMSYQQGPNEGWIMEKRNQLALAAYPALPPDLAELALDEFTKLLQPQFVVTAVRIFTGPGWPIRDTLLPRLEKLPQSQRQMFANILQSRGVDVAVPGIVTKQRPWL